MKLWVVSSAVGSALGPLVGGLLAYRVLPRDEGSNAVPVKTFASLLLVIGVGALCLGLVDGGTWGWTSWQTIVCLVVFLAVGSGLIADSRRSAVPLIPANVMRVRSFAAANVTMLLFSMAFAAGLLALSMWLQDAWGYSALQTGLAIAPGPLLVPVFALGGGQLIGKLTPAYRAALGSMLWAIGTILILLSVEHSADYFTAVLPGWLICGAGVGLTLPTLLASATLELPQQHASSGSAVINVTRQIGTVIGTSALIAVLAGSSASQEQAFHTAWWVTAALAAVAALASFTVATSAENADR